MKRKFALILALLMLASSFASCSDAGTNEEQGDTSSAADTPSSEEVVVEEEEITLNTVKAQYSDRDYDGYNYRIVDRGSGWWITVDVNSEEITGEVINDSVYTRNDALCETLNIQITECPSDAPTTTVKTSITAGTDDYDVFTDGLNSLASLASAGYVMDYKTIDSIKLESEWWDQALINDMSILGHVYFLTGDISIMDNYGTWCYLFNKDMIEDFGLESPYDLVDSGKWTIDKHNEMAQTATLDVNGDGKWTSDDYYGFVTESYNNAALWTCFGNRIVEKDADDAPVYAYTEEKQIDCLIKAVDSQFGSFTNLGLSSTVGVSDGREDQFKNGGALFYFAGMINVTLFRDSDTNFGIIPAPKYNEEQEQYCSSYSFCNFTAYSIPISTQNPETVGDITEIMAHMSVYTLTPAYYDYTLIGKSTRDVESEPMIELIMNTRVFDLGVIFDWGSIRTSFCGFTSSGNIASNLAKTTKTANKQLEKFMSNLGKDEG